MTPNPCYKDGADCERRCVGCRTTCQEWQEWVIIHAKEKDELRQKQTNDIEVDRFLCEQGKRIKQDNYRRGSSNYRNKR